MIYMIMKSIMIVCFQNNPEPIKVLIIFKTSHQNYLMHI